MRVWSNAVSKYAHTNCVFVCMRVVVYSVHVTRVKNLEIVTFEFKDLVYSMNIIRIEVEYTYDCTGVPLWGRRVGHAQAVVHVHLCLSID